MNNITIIIISASSIIAFIFLIFGISTYILFRKFKNLKSTIDENVNSIENSHNNFVIQINDTIEGFRIEIADILEKEDNIDDIITKVMKKQMDMEDQKQRFLESIKNHQVVMNNTAMNFCLDNSSLLDTIPKEYIENLLKKQRSKQ